ncbi:MAG: class I SAM-dependent methyltransferase [Candidatus Cloacimonadota bacterium]|nr:class I SAM-dependent methyltransferase [Candidatus Cloacimonadota bacterium]
MLLYDFPKAYDLTYSPDFRKETMNYFRMLFKNKKIKDVLDCSCGTGQMTIPLMKLGYNVIGSDSNLNMINQAKKNAAEENITGNFIKSDFRELPKNIKRDFDIVMNTGNSLAHVENKFLLKSILSMDKVLKPGGILYIDSRNWDVILERKQRFYLSNPIIRDKGRVNFLQVWDYLKDGSMTFNFLLTEEIENKLVGKRQFYTRYFPFELKTLLAIFEKLEYQNIKVTKLGDPSQSDTDNIDWYTITAVKPIPALQKK